MENLNYINGEWTKSSSNSTLSNVNPSNYKEVIGYFQSSNEEDVNLAFSSAHNSKKGWKRTSYAQRGEILYAVADRLKAKSEEIALLISKEVGKTIDEAKGEVNRGINILKYFAGEGMRSIGENIPPTDMNGMMYTTREPLGVVGIITPWNFPLAIPLWKIAPALIFGNTVVFKPAKEASLTAVKIVECFSEAGIPNGVINLITGSSREIGDTIVEHKYLNGLSFTGSDNVGKRIGRICYENGVKCQLEMGGKNPIIISEKANIQEAVSAIISGAFKFNGQKCTATSRVYIQDSIYDQVKELLLTEVSTIKIGDATDPNNWMGPSNNKGQFDSVVAYIEEAKQDGITLLHGGQKPNENGYFIEPTIFEVDNNQLKLVQEEIFGPVITIMKYTTFDEAIALSNETKYGLSASLFSSDIKEILQFIREIEAGMVRINAETSGVELQAPFGGLKESSSHSREQGRAAMDFYTSIKTVFIK